MQDWKEAKWTFVKTLRNRYIGIEIDGVFCLVDLMPFLTGLLSFPQIHSWQQLPLYYPKTPEAEAEMRKLKISKWKLRKIEKTVAGTSAFLFGLAFVLRNKLYPLFEPLFDKLSIPGILGLLTIVLAFFPMYFYFPFALGLPLRKEIKTYQMSSTKISVRYKQDRKMKRTAYLFLVFPQVFLPFIYFGWAPGFPLGLWMAAYPVIGHVIPNDADVQYLLHPDSQNIKSDGD